MYTPVLASIDSCVAQPMSQEIWLTHCLSLQNSLCCSGGHSFPAANLQILTKSDRKKSVISVEACSIAASMQSSNALQLTAVVHFKPTKSHLRTGNLPGPTTVSVVSGFNRAGRACWVASCQCTAAGLCGPCIKVTPIFDARTVNVQVSGGLTVTAAHTDLLFGPSKLTNRTQTA